MAGSRRSIRKKLFVLCSLPKRFNPSCGTPLSPPGSSLIKPKRAEHAGLQFDQRCPIFGVCYDLGLLTGQG